MGKFNKTSVGVIASGLATFLGTALGWDPELIASATAFITGVAVWLIPNSET